MKTKIAFLTALTLGSVAFAADSTATAPNLAPTPSTVPDSPQKLEKFMVTGSLAEPADPPQKLEKFLVTGSLADPADAPQKLEKFLVTGSLADPVDGPQKLEKFLVTGSMVKPAKAVHTPARLK